MASIMVNVAHVAAFLLGSFIVVRAARTRLSDRALLILTFALCAPMAAFLLKVSSPPNPFEDFTTAYLAAGRAVLNGPDALKPLLELGVNGFVNLPILAYLFAPLAIFPDPIAIGGFFLIGVAAVLVAWRLMVRLFNLGRRDAALLIFAIASFGPLAYSFREGNTSHILLAPILAALVLARSRRDLSAGALLGLTALIKPPLLLIGVYYALIGRWRIAFGGLGFCLAAALASLAIFGWDMHALWLNEFKNYAGAPMPAFNVQSFAAAILRFLTGPEGYADWSIHELPLPAKLANYALTLGALAIAAMSVRALRQRQPYANEPTEFGLVMVISFICIASTVSWSHYYVWLLPGFALALNMLKPFETKGAERWILLCAFLLAMLAQLQNGWLARGVAGPLSGVLVSHLLLGGVLLYALLARATLKKPSHADAA